METIGNAPTFGALQVFRLVHAALISRTGFLAYCSGHVIWAVGMPRVSDLRY